MPFPHHSIKGRCQSKAGRLVSVCIHFLCQFFLLNPALNTCQAFQSQLVIESVFPAGMKAGDLAIVKLTGPAIDQADRLVSNIPGFQFHRISPGSFQIQASTNTKPGFYDLWAAGPGGLSQARSFMVGLTNEIVETGENDLPGGAISLDLGSTVNGCLEKAGDTDFYQFKVQANQSFHIECLAARIDAPIRPVLELFDSKGRRIATNRGYFATDPMIEYRPEADDQYTLKIHELTFTGSASAIYRLEFNHGPFDQISQSVVVAEANKQFNAIMDSGHRQKNQVQIFNISKGMYQSMDVSGLLLPVSSSIVRGFAYHHPSSNRQILVQTSEKPVYQDQGNHHTAADALEITVPADISGTFSQSSSSAWYSFSAKAGEVFHLEGIAQRAFSPADLQISIFDSNANKPLTILNDEFDLPGTLIPTGHLDPVGRWVAPRDGHFLLKLQDLSTSPISQRLFGYRLKIRREEPDFAVIASTLLEPGRLNLRQNGRTPLEILAIRRGGFDGPIRISADNLPSGIEMPEIWIGSGQNRALTTVSAEDNVQSQLFGLQFEASAEGVGKKKVRPASTTPSITPRPTARLLSLLPAMVSGQTALRLNVTATEVFDHPLYGTLTPRHSPGGIVDLALQLDTDLQLTGPLKIRAIGLPDLIGEPVATLAIGEKRGYLSFYLPPSMPIGPLTFIVEAKAVTRTTEPTKETTEIIYSNPVSIKVEPAAFLVTADPFTPRQARRGETIQIAYQSVRRHGFIGKMHTELAMPGKVTDVTGVRGRGETFVGQTDKGSLQVIINDDAPLGNVPFLRLLTIGVLEDQAIYQGASFIDLEIVK